MYHLVCRAQKTLHMNVRVLEVEVQNVHLRKLFIGSGNLNKGVINVDWKLKKNFMNAEPKCVSLFTKWSSPTYPYNNNNKRPFSLAQGVFLIHFHSKITVLRVKYCNFHFYFTLWTTTVLKQGRGQSVDLSPFSYKMRFPHVCNQHFNTVVCMNVRTTAC